MFWFLLFLGVAYMVGVWFVPVKDGLSPYEFPCWDWPLRLFRKF